VVAVDVGDGDLDAVNTIRAAAAVVVRDMVAQDVCMEAAPARTPPPHTHTDTCQRRVV
jgi:hypothetical protein